MSMDKQITLDKHQQAAIDAVVKMVTEPTERRLHFIAGGPGRGKSTIIMSVIDTLKDAGVNRIRICAPTGKAAMVINQMLAREHGSALPVPPASTIHRMLGCQGPGQWIYNKDCRMEADLIILDEASMVDSRMFHRLLYSTETDCRILVTGDHGQLAPVGPGAPFLNFIESGNDQGNVNKLVTNYRQVAGSMLADAVENIAVGKMVSFCEPEDELIIGENEKDADFFFHECEDRDKVAEALADVIEPWHKEEKDYLCVVPQEKGPIGYDKLNPVLQERLNPGSGPGVKVYKNVIRAGDIVRQTKNDYKLGNAGVFNGYIGKVLYADNKSCIVEYPGWPDPEQVEYTTREQLNNLTLGYALTCHAAQGSQAEHVVYLAHLSNYGMLTNQNIYVGVSRAQRECHIVGQLDMVQKAIKNRRSVNRNTHLKELLNDDAQ
jgi:exodeoxyribonuclease V alpha subunit